MARRHERDFPVRKSDVKWKMELDEIEYAVLRRSAAERPFTSDLLDETREGIYCCAGCGAEVFSAKAKFDSTTGWPSFHSPAAADAVGTRRDWKMVLPRTEVHCATCGSHLGHVFNDGPRPSYKRYCVKGTSLRFHLDETKEETA